MTVERLTAKTLVPAQLGVLCFTALWLIGLCGFWVRVAIPAKTAMGSVAVVGLDRVEAATVCGLRSGALVVTKDFATPQSNMGLACGWAPLDVSAASGEPLFEAVTEPRQLPLVFVSIFLAVYVATTRLLLRLRDTIEFDSLCVRTLRLVPRLVRKCTKVACVCLLSGAVATTALFAFSKHGLAAFWFVPTAGLPPTPSPWGLELEGRLIDLFDGSLVIRHRCLQIQKSRVFHGYAWIKYSQSVGGGEPVYLSEQLVHCSQLLAPDRPGIPLTDLAQSLLIGAALLAPGYARVRRTALCPRCDYDLRGNRSGKCPECGEPVLRSPATKIEPAR
ncbi:MAG: hypothetical protein U1A27_10100 [Phycisphaerae bacterium]